MPSGTRGEVFADFVAAHPVWVRNLPSSDEMKPTWHIAGPRMPRIAPVSPTSVSPCGYIIHSDGAETALARTRSGPVCRFCTRWLETLERDER